MKLPMKRNKFPKKTIYYKDPLKDDFAGTKIKQQKIDSNYNFVPKNFFYKIGTYILRGIAMPIIFIIERFYYGIKIKNRKALKGLKGVYLYGNHTGVYDAFTPNLLSFPHRTKIIANPDAVSIKGLRNIVKMLGVIPIPTTYGGMQKFLKDIEYCHNRGENIAIYPEAHIWPYYIGVRPFAETSFRYPIKDGAPVVAFFTAFEKPKGIGKLFRKAKITVYVSDPIYPDMTLNRKDAQEKLRNEVYSYMQNCADKYSTHEVIRYIQIGDEVCDEEELKIA